MATSPSMVFGYIARNFAPIKALYDLSRIDPFLSDTAVESIVEAYGEEISLKRLLEHRILLQLDDTRYELALPLAEAIGYFAEEHSLNSPESIRKYELSFEGLRNGFSAATAPNDIVRISTDTVRELRGFSHDIETMVTELMREARELKSNKEQRDYRQQLDIAIGIVDNYITPVNSMLKTTHEGTIFSLLIDFNKHAFTKRENQLDANIRTTIDQLRLYLHETVERLTQISRTVIEELVPLIRGVQRSSRIMQGALLLLEKEIALETKIPSFGERISRGDFLPYDFFSEAVDRLVAAELDASEIRISFDTLTPSKPKHGISITEIRAKAKSALPISNYHGWLLESIGGEKTTVHELSQCMALLKGADAEFTGERMEIRLKKGVLDAPVINLNNISNQRS